MSGRDPYEKMAPAFEVAIEGSRLGTSLTELVSQVEYESIDGMADEARITIANPDYKLSNSPLWLPGNQLDLWFGYGSSLGYVGRVIIAKPKPKFVNGAMPTIEIHGYTKDFIMMSNTPAAGTLGSKRNFQTDSITDTVEQVASRPVYKFDNLDIDKPEIVKYASIQKSDMTDYNFVQALANTMGWLFWVDYTLDKKWTFHFKNPEGLRVQELKYTFEHFNGDKSTLLEFDPELALTGAVTRLQVQSRDPDSGKLYVEEFDDTSDTPDGRYKGDPAEVIDETLSTAGAVIKFIFGDSSVEVVSDKRFKSAADMKVWADQWWRRKRENFIFGRGSIIGIDDIRARQIHTLKVPMDSICGDYYFARARHVFNSTDGYLVDFTARKVVTG
jgi:phage protein D